ncbi:protease complex subunit PrcB family protein [Flavobacterium hiemivividum]|uniref:Protease complex subunit PrcB family protein n=1 Tax=Flavobacterium hiemivividum TaxID=2541734 RepID=A0A4R5D001_9FLAO|nr:protease complex subunit PrcB family protein [Flavobacterium hiemivividum]TDE03493.1 protease complex subunit PrcB family protein [Flavobacterium hiemivividum]
MKKIPYLLVIFLVVSCGSKAIVDAGKRPLYEVLIQESDGGGNIHFYEILTEPNEIKMLQNDELLKNKISAVDVQKSNFVILNMGEKNSGGYAVGVESVVETDKNIIINVKESSPEPGAMVTQVITYPFCVVKINSKKDIIIK